MQGSFFRQKGIGLALLVAILVAFGDGYAQSDITGDAILSLEDLDYDCTVGAHGVAIHADITGLAGTGGMAGLNAFVIAVDWDRSGVFHSAVAGTDPNLGWTLVTTDPVQVEIDNRIKLVGHVADTTAPNRSYHLATLYFDGQPGALTVNLVAGQSSLGSRVINNDGPGPIDVTAAGSLILDLQQPACQSPEIINPVPGSILEGAIVTFQWITNGSAVTQWWLHVGSASGGSDVHNSNSLGSNLSHTVTDLPTDGRTLYVRLWFHLGGSWQYADYQYTAFTQPGTPEIISPVPGSSLNGDTVTFQWTPNGIAVTHWWLYVGMTQGSSDIYDSGSLGTDLSHTVAGLPIDGSILHVRLWFFLGGSWQYVDYQYTALTQAGSPGITTPIPGTTLNGDTATFQWTADGTAVTQWWLHLGTTLGGSDIYDSGSLGADLSHTVAGLPTDGSIIHVRLWFFLGGSWQFADYQYTAFTQAGSPEITTPTPGTTLNGDTATFQWTDNGAVVTQWWLHLGTTLGGSDIYDSGSLGTDLSHTVAGLPTDGSTLYVRLWFFLDGSWQFTDVQYTASTTF